MNVNMLFVSLTVVLAATLNGGSVNAQQVQQTNVLSNLDWTSTLPAGQLISDSLLMDRTCKTVVTDKVLGFEYDKTGASRIVYQKQCQGWCLGSIVNMSSCQAVTKKVSVTEFPLLFTTSLKLTSKLQVTECQCVSKQCEVTNDNGAITLYNHGDEVIDSCNRKCSCRNGELVNCCRSRKEYRTGLTTSERQRYIDTYKYASTVEPYKTEYRALIASHEVNFSAGIHSTQNLLPWHRWFILSLENILQKIDCRVTVPYWDWSLQATAPFKTTPSFLSIWKSGASELGSDGVAASAQCVTDGAFAGWTTVSGSCLTRQFNTVSSAPLDAADVATIIASTSAATSANYDSFTNQLSGPHGTFHVMHGGTMSSVKAAEAPEFFLHHGFIDKIWSDWQKQSAAHKTTYSATGSSTTSMPAAGNISPSEVSDLDHQYYEVGGVTEDVCVEYEDPQASWWLKLLLSRKSVAALAAIPKSSPAAALSGRWFDITRMNNPAMRAFAANQEAARNDPTKHTLISRDVLLAQDQDQVAKQLGLQLNFEEIKVVAGGVQVDDNITVQMPDRRRRR